jgi:Holliday junction resolvase RusA-like endonuclease
MEIKITVFGEPTAKVREKHFFNPATKRGWAYKTKETERKEDSFLVQCLKFKPDKPLESALKVTLLCYRSIPKSMPEKNKILARIGDIRPTKRPDLDNHIKLFDLFNGIMWADDNQIVSIEAHKWYADQPRTEITITEIQG